MEFGKMMRPVIGDGKFTGTGKNGTVLRAVIDGKEHEKPGGMW
jgi:hypothetical protein